MGVDVASLMASYLYIIKPIIRTRKDKKAESYIYILLCSWQRTCSVDPRAATLCTNSCSMVNTSSARQQKQRCFLLTVCSKHSRLHSIVMSREAAIRLGSYLISFRW